MLEIVNLTHGKILTHHQGTETEDALSIPVLGLAQCEEKVTVNGMEATRHGKAFRSEIPLTRLGNPIAVHAEGNRGTPWS